MAFHIANWEADFPYQKHDYYFGSHSNSPVLKAMADGPKLPAGTSNAKTSKNSDFQ